MSDYQTLHKNSIVVDLHCDTVHKIKRGYSLAAHNQTYHIDIPRLKKGGVNFQAFALFVDNRPDNKNFEYIDYLLQLITSEISKNSHDIMICKKSAEALKIICNNRIAALLAIENGTAIENSLEKLEYFYNKSVRYMTLCHMTSHDWCSSSSDAGGDSYGLTEFGRQVIQKMNQLKMIIDVSHVSQSAFYDVLETSTQPVIASHSNAYALCPHDRNLNDDQLKAIAENNGLVGINFFPMFLEDNYRKAAETVLKKNMSTFVKSMNIGMEKISEEEYKKRQKEFTPLVNDYFTAVKPYQVTIKHVVDHIDYIANLIGVEYIAFGSDFDGIISPPIGLEDCSKMPMITEELVQRGYADEDIKKILGLNFLRVFQSICG